MKNIKTQLFKLLLKRQSNAKILILLMAIVLSINCQATVFQVGSTQTYVSPNALYLANVLQDGDTINIDAETYSGTAALAVWQNNNLLIRGEAGKPHLVADGQYIMGKGIWVLGGNDIIVENIEFSGASVPDHNGAGIRLDGIGLTIRSCYFHNNETGLLTSNPYAGDILIEYSEFSTNGYSDGYSHNLYIGHVEKLTFRFNYSHHASIGHNLKSRANENFIYYNRIMDEQSGNSSRLIDIPNGGFTILMGNLLMQGENAENNNMVGYGKEGLSNSSPHELYVINNTFVNKKTTSCIFLDIDNAVYVANVTNNIFTGIGTIINGVTTIMTNNITEPVISNIGFVNEPNYNYNLNSNSIAVDSGIVVSPANTYSLTPDSIYVHPTNSGARNTNGIIDAGAYEYIGMLSISDFSPEECIVYQNNISGILSVSSKTSNVKNILVFNSLGSLVLSKSLSNKIDLSKIDNGVYFIRIETMNGRFFNKSIVKSL